MIFNKNKAPHLARGEWAEQCAQNFLADQGLKLLTRNFRGKHGEIDLIMEDGRTLVFIEVRFRKSDRFGSAAESITTAKQSRILKTAGLFLQLNKINQPIRFDVITLSPEQPDENHLNWIKNAFQAEY